MDYTKLIGLNNERVANYNRLLFLFYLFKLKRATVSDLAKEMKLSLPAVSRIMKDLKDHGYILLEKQTNTSGRGRKAGVLRMTESNCHIICLEVRPGMIRSVITNFYGDIEADMKTVPLQMTTKDRLIESISKEIDEHLKYLHQEMKVDLSGEKVAIAIALHGQVDHKNGISLFMPQAPWHEPLYVKYLLEQRFHLQVLIDNDCVMRTLAQKWHLVRTNQELSDICVLSLDYGIGSSFLIHHEIYRGSLFSSGQIGHTIVDPGGRRCACGRNGCLEAMASQDAILHRVNSKVHGLYPKYKNLNFDQVCALYHEGNKIVCDEVNKSANCIGLALFNFLNVLNINRIYIYGNICRFGEQFLDVLCRNITANPFDIHTQGEDKETIIEYGTLNEAEQLAGIAYLYGEQYKSLFPIE